MFENRYFFTTDDTDWTLPDLALLGSAGATWVINHFLPKLSTEVAFIRTVATDLASPSAGQVVTPIFSFFGGVDSPARPVNVAAVVALYDLVSGVRRGGRALVGGIPDIAVSENSIVPVYQESLREGFVWLLDLFIGTVSIKWCFVSYRIDGAYRAAGVRHVVDKIVVRPSLHSRRMRTKNLLLP